MVLIWFWSIGWIVGASVALNSWTAVGMPLVALRGTWLSLFASGTTKQENAPV